MAPRMDRDGGTLARVAPVPLSETMRRYLDDFQPLGMSIPTEKGRSELLVAPLLAEVWRRSDHRISLYSGVELNVDEAVGLNGVCNFLLGRSPQLYSVEAPSARCGERPWRCASPGTTCFPSC